MCMSFRIVSILTSLISSTLTESNYYNVADLNNNQQSLFKCEKGGFYPDPLDCRTYYQCIDWGNSRPLTRLKFECDLGTIFSKSKGNTCIHPNEDDKNECNESQNEIDSFWKHSSVTMLPAGSNHYVRSRKDTTDQNKCIEEGFMEDAKDCNKFYRCVKERYDQYVKYEFTCGPGTVWDQQILGCNHPWAVSRKECKTPLPSVGFSANEEGPLEYDENLESNLESANGIFEASTHSSYSDPTNQFPNPNQFDNYPSQPSYLPSFDQPSSITKSKPLDADTTSASPALTEASDFHENSDDAVFKKPMTSTLPAINKPISGEGCDQEGFFADPQDCRKFYRCVNEGSGYSKYTFNCGTGTGWDTELQTCNHLYLLPNCNSESDTSEQTDKSDASSNKDGSTHSQPNDQSFTSSSLNTVSPTYLPPKINGLPSSSTAPTEKQTNNPKNTPVTNSLSSTTSATYLPPSTVTYLPPKTVTYLPPSTVTYLPPNTAKTSTPSYKVSPSTAGSTTGSNLPTSSQTSPQSSGTTSPKEMSTNDEQTSQTSSTASLPITTGSMKSSDTGCQGEGFFPNIDNCRKFYRCVQDPSGYRRFDFDCGPGTAWDQGLQTCNYISQVSTCQLSSNEVTQDSSTSTESPTSKTTPMMVQTTASTSMSTGTSKTSESTDSTSKSPSDNSNCSTVSPNNTIVCNNPGFYAHPLNCSKFYRCVDNGNGFNVYHFDCPPGTIFDPSISVCNYPESVYPTRDCSMASQPSTSSTTTAAESSTSTEEVTSASTTTTNPTEETSPSQATNTQESTTGPEATTSSVETTTLSMKTTTLSMETTTLSAETTSSETTTFGVSSEVPTSEMVSESTGSEMTEIVSTEASTVVTEQSLATTELPSESSTTQESTTATTVTEGTTASDSTEQSSTDQMSTTQSQEMPDELMSTPKPGFDNCPTPANLLGEQVLLVCPTGFKRHPKFCNLLYQCSTAGNMEINILTLSCPENTIFDESKVQCVPEAESSQPCEGSINLARPYRRLDNNNNQSPIKLSTRSICPSEGHYSFQEECSSAFYKCTNNSRHSLEGYLYKCPKDFMYWSVSRRCERVTRLPMCSNLKYQTERDFWQSQWKVPVEDYNLSARMLNFNKIV